MPKIGTQNVSVNGRQMPGEIHYFAKGRFFTFKFPEPVTAWAKVKYPDANSVAQGKSQDELEERIQEVLKEFHADCLTERKVILYRISGDSTALEFERDMKQEYADEDRLRTYRERHNEECKLSLEFRVMLERSVGEVKALYYHETDHHGEKQWEPVGSWGYEDFQRIEWTAEREAFFWDLYKAMESLIGRLNKFLGSEALVLKAIENKVKLLGVQK